MKHTAIQWADHTCNPWIGCTKVSTGCANCYAEVSVPARVKAIGWGKGKPRHRTSELTWGQPKAWNHFAAKEGVRRRVFPSLCDPFDDEVPIDWLWDFLDLIGHTPNLDWLLLTKRPENIEPRIYAHCNWQRKDRFWDFRRHMPNVWLGVSVENQEMADARIPVLLSIPAKIHFVSVEPMLGPVDLEPFLTEWDNSDEGKSGYAPPLDWVIFGGESIGGRECDIGWIRDGIRQCAFREVPVFVKQLGSCPSLDGARVTFKHRKGGDIDEWPEDLRVREFPAV